MYTVPMNAKTPAETAISTGVVSSRTAEATQGLDNLIVRLFCADSKENPHDLSQLPYVLFQAR